MSLNTGAVREALEAILVDLDYDLHKQVLHDEEAGEDGYPDLVDSFIRIYEINTDLTDGEDK